MEYNEEHTYFRFMTQEDNLLFSIPIYGLFAKYLLFFTPRVIVLMWLVHKYFVDAHNCMVLFSAFWPSETSGKQVLLTATFMWLLDRMQAQCKYDTQKNELENNNNNKTRSEYFRVLQKTPLACARYTQVHSRASQNTCFPRAAIQEHRHAGHPPARTCSWLELSSRKQVIKQSLIMLYGQDLLFDSRSTHCC